MNPECNCKTSILQPTPDLKLQEPEIHPALIAWIIIAYVVGCVGIGIGVGCALCGICKLVAKGLK